MAAVVVYPSPLKKGPVWHLVKGQLDGKPCRWTVTVWYDVGVLDEGEENPRRMVVRVRKPTWLADITGLIDEELKDDARRCGGVTNIKWKAIQER